MISVVSVLNLLSKNITIPDYQRPYKWSTKSVGELLGDIESASKTGLKEIENGFKYSVGTVILHKHDDNEYHIVDGQQRTLTLLLIAIRLGVDIKSPLKDIDFKNKTSQSNLQTNYRFINSWFNFKSPEKVESFKNAFCNLLEVVEVVVQKDKLASAFQLFDSQNTKGRALDPHDILKAYHLRKMRSLPPDEMQNAVVNWEKKRPNEIEELFEENLFPIWKWSKRFKCYGFTVNDIDVYKGVSDTRYQYYRRSEAASGIFLITEPFTSGKDFFEYVDYYLEFKKNICTFIETLPNPIPSYYKQKEKKGKGFVHACILFECALMMYLDRFSNGNSNFDYNPVAIKKLFVWSFLIRIDMKSLGYESINKYAIGEGNDRFSNVIDMFFKIQNARTDSEIADIMLNIPDKTTDDSPWLQLFYDLKDMNGRN